MRPILWKKLLSLTRQVSLTGKAFQFCSFNLDTDELPLINQLTDFGAASNSQIVISRKPIHLSNKNSTFILLDEHCNVSVQAVGSLSAEDVQSLKIYLPYCFLSLLAIKENRTIAIAHFAQSLDGKIATFSGDSKWIGNEENLKHAHRMRALTDGIMIGSGTLRNDQPRLNVRLVEGDNPKRIVIGKLNQSDCQCLVNTSPEPVLILSDEKNQNEGSLQFIALPAHDSYINCQSILRCLFQQGIHTVYIEGGAVTTSNFLKDGAIDIFQLHLSPQIFGSGKQGIELPQIQQVKEAIRFENFSFEPVGDTMMFVGRLKTTLS